MPDFTGFRVSLFALLGVVALGALAQQPQHVMEPAGAQNQPPVNNLPNPYRAIGHFGRLTDRKWGATSAIAIDPNGRDIWVADRCGHQPGPGSATGNDTCAGSHLPPVLEFDSTGRLLKSFGADKFIYPHGIFVDSAHDVWVVDERAASPKELKRFPEAAGKGADVIEFSAQGKVLKILGTPGVPGDPPDHLYQPTAVLVAPNGDLFVADGHGGPVARIVKYSKDGKFIKSFGRRGMGPGELNGPHSLAMDSRGRLFVADRSNFRISIFDQDGNFLTAWYQFSRPSGVYIDRKTDTIYVADSESNAVVLHPGWERGIRIGRAQSGKVEYFIPDPAKGIVSGTSDAEGVVADAAGDVYGADVGPEQVVKYVPIRR